MAKHSHLTPAEQAELAKLEEKLKAEGKIKKNPDGNPSKTK